MRCVRCVSQEMCLLDEILVCQKHLRIDALSIVQFKFYNIFQFVRYTITVESSKIIFLQEDILLHAPAAMHASPCFQQIAALNCTRTTYSIYEIST